MDMQCSKENVIIGSNFKAERLTEVQKYIIAHGIWNVFLRSNFTVEGATVKSGEAAWSHYIQYIPKKKKKKKEKPKRRLSWDDGTNRHFRSFNFSFWKRNVHEKAELALWGYILTSTQLLTTELRQKKSAGCPSFGDCLRFLVLLKSSTLDAKQVQQFKKKCE